MKMPIILAVGIALVWALAFALGFPWWAAAGLTLVIGAAAAVVHFTRRMRAAREARGLERALAEQHASHARMARPDAQAEVREMQAEFERAIAALESSRSGRGGARGLYALPWYVIVGPPGAGKSTALRNSGLTFPYLSSRTSGGVPGLGGTRNCDWWLTNQAVLLDTAGRWATQDEDRAEWLGFLDLLRTYRSRKPLNGIIAAVSLAELGSASPDDVAELARNLRDRIDEAMTQLKTALPVYVVFTKCDLVPGFAETFGDLPAAQRAQIWGFTARVTDSAQDPGERFSAEMAELTAALDARALRRLGEERQIRAREQILAFPEQFAVLVPKMRDLVERLFEDSVFRDTPVMRGVYFTSGTQEGRPIDRVMHKMASALGLKARTAIAAPVSDSKSYFLHDAFTEVMFADAALAVPSEAERHRHRRRGLLVGTASAVAAILLMAFPAYAYFENVALIERIDAAVADAQEGEAGDGARAALEVLEPLRTALDELDGYEEDGVPIRLRGGMYVGDDLQGPLASYHAAVVRRAVIEPLAATELAELARFGREYEAMPDATPPNDVHRAELARLRRHLLLTVPREDTQPALEGELAASLPAELAQAWATAASAQPDTVAAIRPHVDRFVRALAANDAIALSRDSDTVRRARSALSRLNEVRLALDEIVHGLEGRGYEITLRDLLGGTVQGFHAQRTIPGAFTRRAYEEHVRPMLGGGSSRRAGETWVLGASYLAQRSDADAEATRRQTRNEYFRRYTEEWQEFLRGLRVDPPGNHGDALALARDLTRGSRSALERLFRGVAWQVELAEPEPAAQPGEASIRDRVSDLARNLTSGGVPEEPTSPLVTGSSARAPREPRRPGGLDEADVTAAFVGFTRFGVAAPAPEGEPPAPTALDAYEEQLIGVRDAIQTYIDDPGTDTSLAERLQEARTSVRGLVGEQEVGWRPVFDAVLWPPIDGASMSLSRASAGDAGRTWCSAIVATFDESLRGRYPFDASGQDASLADFAEFFRPREGFLWVYYGEELERYVPRDGAEFRFETRLGRPTSQVFQPTLLAFLERAQDVGAAFFPAGSTDPKVEIDVRIRPSPTIATQVFALGGKSFEYHNGPEEWVRFAWPGDSPETGASVEIRGADGIHEQIREEGEWGLFRLFEAGTIEHAPGSRVFRVTFNLRSHGVTLVMDVKPARSDAPFFVNRAGNGWLDAVRGSEASPPREIVTEARLCGGSR